MLLSQIPEAEAYYITFDIDGYDMTLAPAQPRRSPVGSHTMRVWTC